MTDNPLLARVIERERNPRLRLLDLLCRLAVTRGPAQVWAQETIAAYRRRLLYG
jgi:hypothetical protein